MRAALEYEADPAAVGPGPGDGVAPGEADAVAVEEEVPDLAGPEGVAAVLGEDLDPAVGPGSNIDLAWNVEDTLLFPQG